MTDGGRVEGWADDRHLDDDELTELALGHVDGPARAHMAAHLLTCTACRHEYDALVATIEDGAAGGAGGPAAARLRRAGARADPAAPPPPAALVGGRGGRRALVAVAAAGRLVGGVEHRRRATSKRRCSPVPTAARSARCRSSDVDGDRVMVVAIVDAPPDVSYTCRPGSPTARWSTRTRGSPAPAPGSCRSPADGDVTDVDLVVTGTDHVWSSATFDLSERTRGVT